MMMALVLKHTTTVGDANMHEIIEQKAKENPD